MSTLTENKVPAKTPPVELVGKVCTKCQTFKPWDQFQKAPNGKYGLKSICRSCAAIVERNARTPEKAQVALERNRQRRNKNLELMLLYGARARAKRSGIPFNLTIADIRIPEFCPVLGYKLEKATGEVKYNSPSLDRIIPELGYVVGNCVVISWRANALKFDASVSEIEKITEYIRTGKEFGLSLVNKSGCFLET